eukprot:2052384-Rhodomonas_salina.1
MLVPDIVHPSKREGGEGGIRYMSTGHRVGSAYTRNQIQETAISVQIVPGMRRIGGHTRRSSRFEKGSGSPCLFAAKRRERRGASEEAQVKGWRRRGVRACVSVGVGRRGVCVRTGVSTDAKPRGISKKKREERG